MFSIRVLVQGFLFSLVRSDRDYFGRIWLCASALVLYIAIPLLPFPRVRRRAWKYNLQRLY